MAQKEFTILNDPCYPKISPHFLDSALQIVMVIVRLIVLSSYLISHKLTFSLSLFSSPLRNKFLKMYGERALKGGYVLLLIPLTLYFGIT